MLPVAPKVFDWVEFRGGGRQVLQHDLSFQKLNELGDQAAGCAESRSQTISRGPRSWRTRFARILSACTVLAQDKPQRARDGHIMQMRPPVFFKETWKQPAEPGEHPISPDVVGNPNLELKLYGASAKDIQVLGEFGKPRDSAESVDGRYDNTHRRDASR